MLNPIEKFKVAILQKSLISGRYFINFNWNIGILNRYLNDFSASRSAFSLKKCTEA